jgi:hypothetical protein
VGEEVSSKADNSPYSKTTFEEPSVDPNMADDDPVDPDNP